MISNKIRKYLDKAINNCNNMEYINSFLQDSTDTTNEITEEMIEIMTENVSLCTWVLAEYKWKDEYREYIKDRSRENFRKLLLNEDDIL